MRSKVPSKTPPLIRGMIFGFVGAVVICLVFAGVLAAKNSQSQQTAGVPAQSGDMAGLPPPQGTSEPTLPPATPTRVVIPTPTVKVWPPADMVPDITISLMSTTSETDAGEKSTIDRTEAISQYMWGPLGEKLLYLTVSGNLYWSNIDGSEATLLQHYDEIYDQLEEQMPKSDTVLVRHIGQLQSDGSRTPSHLDVIRFTLGDRPVLVHGPDLVHAPIHIHWWSSTRASGIAHTGYDGGDLLVTVDQDGNLVSEINIPYMLSGAVRPGGEWLAYATGYQVESPIEGSSAQTVYLLNLNTGQRLQVTAAGAGGGVGKWSPDGNWFLMSSGGNVSLVSANGRTWVTIPDGSATTDAAWSPDSKYLAFATLKGASSDGHDISSWTGSIHIVNVPIQQVTNLASDSGPLSSLEGELLWQPKWSRDSSTLSFLTFDPDCPFACSELLPAIVNLAPK